jgi:hypothetical protein
MVGRDDEMNAGTRRTLGGRRQGHTIGHRVQPVSSASQRSGNWEAVATRKQVRRAAKGSTLMSGFREVDIRCYDPGFSLAV